MLDIGASSRATHKDNMHITRSFVLVSTLVLVLLVPFCAKAEEKPHVTSEQVNRAIQELEKLAQKQIHGHCVSTRVAVQTNWLDGGCRAGR